MIQGIIDEPLTLTSNTSVVTFEDNLRTRSANCCGKCGWLQHQDNSPLYKIIEGGIYDITFTGTVTSATAGIVALAILQDGVELPYTVSAETLAAAGDLANISISTSVRVCPNGSTSFSLASVPSVLAGADLVSTDTQIPIITNGTLSIKKRYV